MYTIGTFEEDEFAIAEERLLNAPQSDWTTVSVTPHGWQDKLHVQFRDIIVLMAGMYTNKCNLSYLASVFINR